MTRRALGIDPGDVRIGLALSDTLRLTAQPVDHLECIGSRRDLNNLANFARENDVSTIIVGLPLTLAGEEGPAATASRELALGTSSVRFPRGSGQQGHRPVRPIVK